MSMKALGPSFDLHLGGEDLIFPHHENEIAQSESLTGKDFAHFWFHSRFLLVEGEKMSKSLGNFYTLRDLVLKGHKPSAIRYLLTSVPYRNQLNFTMDGLQQATASVERLRNFQARLTSGKFPEGANPEMAQLAADTVQRIKAGLDDDLNTAQAQGAIFDMIRAANSAIDAAQLKQSDVAPLLAALQTFDEIFGVLKDEDAARMSGILAWAKAEGRQDIAPSLIETVAAQELSSEVIEQKIAAMEQARKARDFKQSDALRAELTAAGIVIENTKDGVRWRRK
jgi:cysteinyl-tRNA synthetase